MIQFDKQTVAAREAFGLALRDFGTFYENLVVLDADVQNSTYTELFHKKFPHRFIQCFIAEQNMVGVGVGLALQGFIPFITTFAAFLTRAHDQIRMAAIGRAPLRIVGSHVGVSIGADGPSQMGLEDIALMRTIPHSLVFSPADAISTYRLTHYMIECSGSISYLRTMRGATPHLYPSNALFYAGGCHILRQPSRPRVCIVAHGITVYEALIAHEKLQQEGIYTTVIDCYSIKPLPETTLREAIQYTQGNCIVVEDHYREGGLGEAIALTFSRHKFNIISLAVSKIPRSGTPQELRSFEGIDAHAIIKAVKDMC
jgi:transketolase